MYDNNRFVALRRRKIIVSLVFLCFFNVTFALVRINKLNV